MYVPRAAYSLRMSFWIVPESFDHVDAAPLRDDQQQREEDRRRRVDGHRDRDAVERDLRRAASPCRRSSRSPRRLCRPRRARARRRSPSRSASAGRRRPRGRSCRARAGSGSAGSTRPRSRSRRTAASSTACRGTSSACGPRVYGNSPGAPRSRCGIEARDRRATIRRKRQRRLRSRKCVVAHRAPQRIIRTPSWPSAEISRRCPGDLLQWLSLGQKTGTLVVHNKSVEKKIFFKGGRVISSASNDPREYLGQFLMSHGYHHRAGADEGDGGAAPVGHPPRQDPGDDRRDQRGGPDAPDAPEGGGGDLRHLPLERRATSTSSTTSCRRWR